MMFWALVIIISLAAILPVGIGLLRQKPCAAAAIDHDRVLYEARINEIEADHRMGRIDDAGMETAKAEEGRKLIRLQEKRVEQTGSGLPFAVNSAFLALVMLVVPLGAIAVYSGLGTPPSPTTAQVADAGRPPSMEELLAAAEKRLENNPDEAQGWRVIAPVYMRLLRFEDAQRAFENLVRIEGERPELLLGLAEARILNANNVIDDQAIDKLNKVLNSEPQNARARFLLGAAMLQRGNEADAREIWENMLAGANGDEPWFNAVRTNLAELDNSSPSTPSRFTAEQLEQINAMVTGLADRLSQEKGSKEDWERLIRSYMVLDRRDEAEAAFQRASSLFAGEAEFIATLNTMITGEGAQ